MLVTGRCDNTWPKQLLSHLVLSHEIRCYHSVITVVSCKNAVVRSDDNSKVNGVQKAFKNDRRSTKCRLRIDQVHLKGTGLCTMRGGIIPNQVFSRVITLPETSVITL